MIGDALVCLEQMAGHGPKDTHGNHFYHVASAPRTQVFVAVQT